MKKVIAYDLEDCWRDLFRLLRLTHHIHDTFEESLASAASELAKLKAHHHRLLQTHVSVLTILGEWAEITSEFGLEKFRTPTDLMKAYKSAESALTKKSQELVQLKRAIEAVKLGKED